MDDIDRTDDELLAEPAPPRDARAGASRSSHHGVARLLIRTRGVLAVVVLGLMLLNRVVLFSVALPNDWPYLMWGWLPAADGTLVDPLRAPWLIIGLVALAAWVARPGGATWALVVVTFLLPNFTSYSAGPIQLWEPHILDLANAGVLHLPAAVLLAVLVLLVVGTVRRPSR